MYVTVKVLFKFWWYYLLQVVVKKLYEYLCNILEWLTKKKCLISAGRYGDPSELPKLIVPLAIAAAILVFMLGMVLFFYWKKGKLTCHCDCCIKFRTHHTKMDNCACDSSPPRTSNNSQFSSFQGDDSGCGTSCRCEQLQKRLDAEIETTEPQETVPGICSVCTTRNETCSNCKNKFPDVFIPKLGHGLKLSAS